MRRSSGSALVITLGLLAVLGLLVFGYVYSARTERFAARHARDRLTARQFVDLALNAALDAINTQTTGNGYVAGFDAFIRMTEARGDAQPAFLDFYQTGTNQIPLHFHAALGNLTPIWIPIQGISEDNSANVIGTNGYITFAIFNCSGLLDANVATSNQLAWLASQADPDITDLNLFLQDRARATATNGLVTQYLDLHDLRLRSRGLAEQPRSLFTWSYDPGPDVTVTNGDVYSNRDVQLVPKFNVNSWTNGLEVEWDGQSDVSDLSDLPDKLTQHYQTTEFLDWLHEVTNRFAAVGLANPPALAWNLVNFMDPDRIPQGPEGPIAWQEPWPVEDVPLINEVAVGMVPMDMIDNQPNHYAPGVELWYPFATNRITEADEAQLVVAVYTNWVPDHYAHDTQWTNNVIFPEARFGFTFSNVIPGMAQGTITEFATATLPPPYVSFPVQVTRAVTTPAGASTRFMPETGTDTSRLVAYDDRNPVDGVTPPVLYLAETNLFLPLGIATYTTYLPEPPVTPSVWVKTTVTVTNTIHLLARVRLGDAWVDEAAGYRPGEAGREARTNLLAFTEPCGYEVNDPRRNGTREDWHRYLPANRATPAWDASAGPRPVCSLDGSTNVICNPWHKPYGQGLPLTHFNRLLDRAGDIGHIQQPEHRDEDNTEASTNLWQSICLADPRPLRTSNGFTFGAGSVLEFFTVRVTNTPVRGLVHFSTTHTNVVETIAADIPLLTTSNQTVYLGSGIEWFKRAFFQAQFELYGQGSFPVGIGVLGFGFGASPVFLADPDIAGVDDGHWQGSLGNDRKEDLIRGLAERVSFRQHVFVICLAGKTVTPAGRTIALQRAVAIVLRDAYTGRWKVVGWQWL